MNRKMICRIVGLSLLLEAVLLLLPAVAGLCFGERPYAFLLTAAAAAHFLCCLLPEDRRTHT